MDQNPDLAISTLAETDNYAAWRADEPDDESTFHLELNNVTVHFFLEEWKEFIELVNRLPEVDY